MKQKIWFLLLALLVLICEQLSAQLKISGIVESEQNEAVPYAYIIDEKSNYGTITNIDGQFTFISQSENPTLKVSHVAYSPKEITLNTSIDTFITIVLENRTIKEITVRSTPLARQAMIGTNFLEGKTIQNIPTFFGEQDIVKAMTILPGISNGLDLYSNLYVRGGERDQNLFLMDGARFYTSSHAGGFASLFNPDIIKHIDIYKGGAPAKYGDGLSSVVDITLKKGSNKPKLNIDIGTMRSGFLNEGRIGKKLNYIFAGRFSYWDIVNGNLYKEKTTTDDINQTRAYSRLRFWDVDGKITYSISPRTSLNLNSHLGKDENSFFEKRRNHDLVLGANRKVQSGGTYITNNNITLGFKHISKRGTIVKNTAWFTHYQLDSKSDTKWYLAKNDFIHDYSSRKTYIKDYSDKLEVSFRAGNKHQINIGTQITLLQTTPEKYESHSEYNQIDTTYNKEENNASDISVFLEDDIKLSNHVHLRAGIRGTHLKTKDSTFYSIQPRTTLRWLLNKNTTLKTGISLTQQPFHVLVNTYGYYQEESWLLANKQFLPQKAWQFSSGISGKIKGSQIEYNIEAYYKNMQNMLFYAPPDFEMDAMTKYIKDNGKGKSYGTEFLFQKGTGQIQWSVAYTLSWSFRKFDDLNNGKWFAASFDRRHDLNIGLHYFRNEKDTWNFNYLLQSGRAYTMPEAYVPQSKIFTSFYVLSSINNARTPMYRRFDVSYKHKGSFLGIPRTELTLSIMNLFARKNPFAIYAKKGNLYLSTLYWVLPSAKLKIYLFK